MLSLALEIPAAAVPRRIVADCWQWLRRSFPGECGHLIEHRMSKQLMRIALAVPRRRRAYELLLDALTSVDVWARRLVHFPSVYGSVRYERELDGSEVWASTPALFSRGYGDCEDLACDRAAELVTRGIPAVAALQHEGRVGAVEQWHVVVARESGIEDPSATLGMK